MNYSDKTKATLLEHCKAHPALLPTDVFKFLYQSSFGCEHMVSSQQAVTEYIKKEHSSFDGNDGELYETLDGEYVRLNLCALDRGMSAETLAGLFMISAKKEENGQSLLKEKLAVAEQMAKDGLFPFGYDIYSSALEEWKSNGLCPIHHSESFRTHYKPSYRVISKSLVPFLSVFTLIDQRLKDGSLHMAIEGGAASGKTTFAKILESIYDCTVFHMDDFFLRPEQRTEKRLEEVGGNIDRERFLEEVLIPLRKQGSVNYRRFNCSDFTIEEPITMKCKRLVVTEGVYSMHRDFEEYYDISVFIEIDEKLQRERIVARNSPPLAKRFFDEWIPMENRYFDGMRVKDRCELIIYAQ